jgi:hypothetical protein
MLPKSKPIPVMDAGSACGCVNSAQSGIPLDKKSLISIPGNATVVEFAALSVVTMPFI